MRFIPIANPSLRTAVLLVSWGGFISALILLVTNPGTALASGLANSDWPTFGGNSAHSKISPSKNTNPLTLYMRTTPDPTRTFQTNSSPAIVNGVIYAILDDNQNGPPELLAYDIHGNLRWRSPMPLYSPIRQSRAPITTGLGGVPSGSIGARGAHNPTVADDGTIYVGWANNIVTGKGITAFFSNGNVKFAGVCYHSNANDNFLITLDSQGNSYWINNDGSVVSLGLFSCNPDGSTRWAASPPIRLTSNEWATGYGVAIDANNVIYYNTRDGTHAIRSGDSTDIWVNPARSTVGFNNNQISPDGKWLATAGSPSLVSLINALTGQTKWQYSLNTSFGTFAFGLNNRLYISANTKNATGLINGAGIPINPATTKVSAGKECAVDLQTGLDIWCTITPGHLQQAGMVVDSTNSVYFCDIAEGSFVRLDANGNVAFKYLDKKIIGGLINTGDFSCWDVPAMSDDGKLYFQDSYLYGFRPWTLDAAATKQASGSDTLIHFTVHSSMMKRDPQDGVTADNQVQIKFNSGQTIPLKYLHQEGDDSVWEGSYTAPSGQDLSHAHVDGTVEAIASSTQSSLTTHFVRVPSGFNNTGMVQAFDLGTVDTLPGQSAQSLPTPNDFTRVYDEAIAWIRDTSQMVWSTVKHCYSVAYDFVMR